ncbi:hypothetical protein [Zhongshania aquimaris]|uniref:Uncharacterized protein n=1 Tax=Zhongshania aquimaris TaxID=2857107 RepID=A0ABS6VST1_9GAMM|nr:hypothetical protein [Zhongshania aquimaris]MBW2941084.1 hypothetical protein [Zhongshania aquimaris]
MRNTANILALLLLSVISNGVFADCAARAVYRAPEIPRLQETTFAQVVKLEKEVRNYIEDADQRLEACGKKVSPVSYNAAINRMERVTNAYNELVVFYKQNDVRSTFAAN